MLSYIDRRLQLIKSFYTGIGKSTLLFPTAFLSALGQGLVTLGIIFYVRDVFLATPIQVGTLTGLWSLSYIVGCVFLRPLTDGILPRYLLIMASLLECLFMVLILLTGNLTVLFGLYALFGMSISFFWPPLMGWLSHGKEGAELGRLMARFNFSWSVGSIVSPYFAGLLSERNEALPLLTGCLLFLLAGTLITVASLTIPKIRADRAVHLKIRRGVKNDEQSTPLRFPAWIGVLTTYTTIGVIVNIFPLHALNALELSKRSVGLIMQNRALFGMIGFVVMGRTTFWHFRPAQMIIGQIALIIFTMLLVTVRTSFILGSVISCIGFFMAVSYFNSMFHGVTGSVNRSHRMAIHESLISSGLILGSVVGGLIYQRSSMAHVYLFCAAFVFFGAVLQSILCLRPLPLRDQKG
jgi:DHA1 family multidrug resistance protein-like MFS transporter/DHA1 family quinolone resistance protein-like MFS transporter